MNVFSFSLSGRFCVQWLILWQVAYFFVFPYLSNGFLPSFGCSLLVNSCLVILQFGLFDCCGVGVRFKYLGVWYSIFVFFLCNLVSLFFSVSVYERMFGILVS